MEKPLLDQDYTLQKFPGKGGWTYASIPEVLQSKTTYFGWVKVKGSIDDFELKNFRLMPAGDGTLFLPVRAEIRKKIKKQAGDSVRIILYSDESTTEIPPELILCLQDAPGVYEKFVEMTDAQQSAHIRHIYSSANEETRVNRIALLVNKVLLTIK